MTAITVNFNSVIDISDEQFYQLCLNNPDTKFERNADGEIIIMPPTGGETGKRNSDLVGQFWAWNRQQRDSTSRTKFGVSRAQTKLGEVFDSSTGYKLPSGANRSPDVSWIKQERWDSLTAEQRQKFIPLAPDFALELMFPSDYLINTQNKMKEYLDNGVKLGWLINPEAKQVEIYRLGKEPKLLNSPQTLSDEDVLPGLMLDLANIFSNCLLLFITSFSDRSELFGNKLLIIDTSYLIIFPAIYSQGYNTYNNCHLTIPCPPNSRLKSNRLYPVVVILRLFPTLTREKLP